MKILCSHSAVVDVDSLVPHPLNPNLHSQKQIKLYAKILKHQGWRKAITVSNRSGFVVTGHGAIQAARLNEWKEVPIDRQDFETEADEYAHMVADNKLPELANLDLTMVTDDVAKLGENFDFDLLGIPGFGNDPTVKNTSVEFQASDFDGFDHECPKCGFEWDDKNND